MCPQCVSVCASIKEYRFNMGKKRWKQKLQIDFVHLKLEQHLALNSNNMCSETSNLTRAPREKKYNSCRSITMGFSISLAFFLSNFPVACQHTHFTIILRLNWIDNAIWNDDRVKWILFRSFGSFEFAHCVIYF